MAGDGRRTTTWLAALLFMDFVKDVTAFSCVQCSTNKPDQGTKSCKDGLIPTPCSERGLDHYCFTGYTLDVNDSLLHVHRGCTPVSLHGCMEVLPLPHQSQHRPVKKSEKFLLMKERGDFFENATLADDHLKSDSYHGKSTGEVTCYESCQLDGCNHGTSVHSDLGNVASITITIIAFMLIRINKYI
ncbi:uncharacterized protein LOC106167820 [Lingula anatina]|uniref:Uncharacterized protein LOC106167820 n=1 Tax=Lingula anatina TaxID=7574 RepID=A0A2R2MSG1_LINAN|nr:uncharacterized protein LOC106167820 [Lingula anatina]|eukprot:XP_023933201.1 uncharacterized protein LOC106167820 [Lingula anatina]